ncbi:hypothetical protein [Sphingomonas colocasiae]|uniref:Uncharacterized protein n=1 Tax=Sphingomonas colocasiae TaxID=1848973 RepID=A0ABS7PNB2_9SPHN|nr:hypothetical protein [Sphingomonas colocasiae]MBY8822807.1 hypothetical protein [Sphingomonas colocasiae]
MPCCGALALFATLLIGARRWLGNLPRSLRTVGGGMLLVMPVLALAGATAPEPSAYARIPDHPVHAWCGRPLE